jgi:hypothetical protein
MRTRLKLLPTKRCTIGCGMCYWPKEQRESSPIMPLETMRQVIREGKGFRDLHLFSGEYPGYAEELFLPALEMAEEYSYTEFMTTASGVYLSAEHIERALKLFSGMIHFRLSIDGPWGHGNWSDEGRHGEVLTRFIEAKERTDRIRIHINWAHKAGPQNDRMKDAFQQRCEEAGIFFWRSFASDLRNDTPQWGESIVPAKVGLDSEDLDSLIFAACAMPSVKHNNPIKQVQVGMDETYYLCKCGAKYFQLGKVGSLGEGNLLPALEEYERSVPRLIQLMQKGSIIEVARKLLETEKREEVEGILQKAYPKNCGGCNLCLRLIQYFPLLERGNGIPGEAANG